MTTLIIDPDFLTDPTEILITTSTKKIKLNYLSGNLGPEGVTLKCIYSKLKELWKSNATYIAFPFPMQPITDESFEFINGWTLDSSGAGNYISANLIRTGGWAVKDAGGVSTEEWIGVVTLGSIGVTDQVYYQQNATGSAANVVNLGVVNQAVKVYTSGGLDQRAYFKLFVREYQKLYAAAQLSDIGVTTNMTYQVYRFPLANAADLNIIASDAEMTGSPYNGMSITYSTASVSQSGLVGGSFPFKVTIAGNNGSTQQIYTYVQHQLRQPSDIDAGTGIVTGTTAGTLLNFVGSTLYTLQPATLSGTFITSINNTYINDVFFADDSGTNRYYPYSAVLTLQFGDNLVADSSAIYHVFFTNDDAGNNAGADFGTATAITANNASSVAISGTISGSSSITTTYDYDGNVQRGAASSGTNAPITVVAIGLNTAQYVKSAATILRSKTNSVSLVAPLERNYNNPV